MVPIESIKLFSGLSAADLDELRAAILVREFEREQAVFREGERGDGIYIVRSGEVEISALVPTGERKPLVSLGPGDWIVEFLGIECEPHLATAKCLGKSSVYHLPHVGIVNMLERCPSLAFPLVREFSEGMRAVNKRFADEAIQAERLSLSLEIGSFARSMMQDFTTLLKRIGLAAKALDPEPSNKEDCRTAVAGIRTAVDRLQFMIAEVLEFSRGPLQLPPRGRRTDSAQLGG